MSTRAKAWLALLLLIAGCATPQLHPEPTFKYIMLMRALAYSPDSELLLVLRERERNELAIVDAKTLRLVRTLSGSEGRHELSYVPPGAIAFSSDGALVAVAGLDDIVTVWDARTWGLLARLPETKWASGVVFLRDDITLATAGPDSSVRFWNARTGALTGGLSGHEGAVLSIAISPDGRLATGGVDRTARVWDVATRSQIAAFNQSVASVVSLAFSVDGKQLATSADGYGALLWDLDGPRDARPPEVQPAPRDYSSFARVVTPGVVVLGRGMHLGSNDLFCPLAMSPDGKLLAVTQQSSGWFGWSLAIYSMSSLSPVEVATNYLGSSALAFSPNGKTLAVWRKGWSNVSIVDPYTGEELQKVELPK